MHPSIENANYFNDRRNRSHPEPILHLEDGTELHLPVKWAVCPGCDGEGSHINPGVDCGGLSAEDFAEDPDFAEDYMNGVYDVTCNVCNGRTTVPEVDWEKLSPEHRAAYEAQLKADDDYHAERLAEIRMGA